MAISESLKRGTVELMILTLLAEEDLYGYQLCQILTERSKGLYKMQQTTLYPTLYHLVEKKLVSDRVELIGRRRTRVYYHLEDSGREYLTEIRNNYLSLTQGIFHVLGLSEIKEVSDEKSISS